MAQDPLPSFIALLGFLIPLVAIALAFDAINGEFNRRTLSRILAQPIYRDALLLGKFLAGLLGADDRPGLAVAAGARSRPAVVRRAAEHRGDRAHARLPRRDDRLWRGMAGAGAVVLGGVPRAGHRRARRARRMAAVRAVLVGGDAARRQPDRRPARGRLRAAHLAYLQTAADDRPDLAQHALRRDRAGPVAAGDPRARAGADQPTAGRAARRAAAGVAELPVDLAAADRTGRGDDRDLRRSPTSPSSARKSALNSPLVAGDRYAVRPDPSLSQVGMVVRYFVDALVILPQGQGAEKERLSFFAASLRSTAGS